MADEYIDKVEVGAKIQMMYIRREMDYGGENDFCRGMRKALRVIENMPAADVQPVKHGRWLPSDSYITTAYGTIHCQKCSECGADIMEDNDYDYDFCPVCGARMDGDKNG